MNTTLEITPRAVSLFSADGSTVWAADLTTQNGRKTVRRLAAQLLMEQPTVLKFERDGRAYPVPVSSDLASRLAAVCW